MSILFSKEQLKKQALWDLINDDRFYVSVLQGPLEENSMIFEKA